MRKEMELMSKSSLPSDAGNPIFVQHQVELRWTVTARCEEPIHVEGHLCYAVAPHICCNKTIHLVLTSRNAMTFLMATRANLAAHIQKLYLRKVCLQGIPVQSLTLFYRQGYIVVTDANIWVSQALNTRARIADVASSTSLTQPQYPPQGSQYIVSVNVDFFPSMNYMSLFKSKVEMVTHIFQFHFFLMV